MTENKKSEFWSSRAHLGQVAGTNDFLLKRLELDLILEKIPDGAPVLDVGCGNGVTLIRLAQEKGCTGTGIDFAEEMINVARKTSEVAGYSGKVHFQWGVIPGLPHGLGEFDYVLTERCLINLDSVSTQHQAFLEIMSHVKRGGYYLMIESSIQGLERINKLRDMLDLELIDPPWHNVFLDESSVIKWANDEFSLEEIIPFSSTYYFLSRVVYARLASDRGEELRYDSDINILACKLPIIGDFGPARLWLWRRKSI